VTIELGPAGTGTITFVDPQSSNFRDIEGLAWMRKTQVAHLLSHENPTTSVPSPAAVAYLGQNAPNPFNPVTRIDFVLQRSEHVELAVFDVVGRRVATLLHERREAGPYTVQWNGMTQDGRHAASGVYRYVLSGSGWQQARSMILAK